MVARYDAIGSEASHSHVVRCPRWSRPAGTRELDRHSAVANLYLESSPLPQCALRGDHELLAASAPTCPLAINLDPAHVEPDEVEVEAAQVLGGGCAYRRIAVELVCRRVIGDIELVVPDVVAAIPVQREIRVSEPGRAGNGNPARELPLGSQGAMPRLRLLRDRTCP
jgi:hypothetical protein